MTARKMQKILMSYGVQRNQARSIAAACVIWGRRIEEMKREREERKRERSEANLAEEI